MKFRLTLFFVFQVVAWTTYFNWETTSSDQDIAGTTEKVLQVKEMSAGQFVSFENHQAFYKLILRDDGFFTKINTDQSLENGLWAVNHEIPSLILKSPKGDMKYRILDKSGESIQVELMNNLEFIQTSNVQETERKLFSSVN
jgi:hypothetical protein